MSSWFGSCRHVSFPQASDESLCRPVPAHAGYVRGHRAPMEHRDRQPVLHRRTSWGSGETVDAADFRSAGSVGVEGCRSTRPLRPRAAVRLPGLESEPVASTVIVCVRPGVGRGVVPGRPSRDLGHLPQSSGDARDDRTERYRQCPAASCPSSWPRPARSAAAAVDHLHRHADLRGGRRGRPAQRGSGQYLQRLPAVAVPGD
jgi:hypothetical protein